MGSNQVDKGLVPTSDDEAHTKEKLFGRNEATAVELHGWTNTIIIKFIGAKADLSIRTLPIEDICNKIKGFQWNAAGYFEWECDHSPVMKLSEMNSRGDLMHFKITQPLTVQVLEKKAVEVIIKDRCVFMIGKILVGDETGFCVLATFNDNIEYLYNKVDIGDRLILMNGSMRKSDHACDSNYFNTDKFLSGELKVRNFETRAIYRVQQQKFLAIPEYLLPPMQVYWLPSNFERKDSEGLVFPVDRQCINICGVVSYVGRITRVEAYRETNINSETKVQYYSYRWIQLIDRTVKKPISIKLILNNLTWDEQKDLLPGTALLLTNVQCNASQSFLEFHLVSTKYTRMYINFDILSKYIRLLPPNQRKIIRDICNAGNVVKIFSRQDVDWMVGGSLTLPISNRESFLQYYEELKKKRQQEKEITRFGTLNGPLDPSEPLSLQNFLIARREEQRIYVRGFVTQTYIVPHEGTSRIIANWTLSPDHLAVLENYNKTMFKVPKAPLISGKNCDDWFCFRRKFPITRPKSLKDGKEVIAAYEENLKHRDLCQCLLLPSDTNSARKFKDLPVMKDEEKRFLVYIVDFENNEHYACFWNTFTFDKMKERLEDVKLRVTEKVEAFKKRGEVDPATRRRLQLALEQSYLFIIDCHRIENPKLMKANGIHEEDFIQDHWDIKLIDFVEYHQPDQWN